MMKQRELIHKFNDEYRPKFNQELFKRSDDELIEAIRDVVYSCERDSSFTIKVTNFQVIDDYDDVNHILWEYEDSIINKGKKSEDTKNAFKCKDNQYNFS